MMRLSYARSVLLAILSASSAVAQTTTVDKVLLPIALARVPGAFGSQWDTNLSVTNLSNTPVQVVGYTDSHGCTITCPPPPPIAGHVTRIITNSGLCDEVRGSFLYVETGRLQDVAMTLRTTDLSRQAETWGTVIPVVTPSDVFDRTFGLTDVPTTGAFRSTLRIYSTDATTPSAVRVRLYAVDPAPFNSPARTDPDPLLADITPQFAIASSGGGTSGCPASIEMSLSDLPQVFGQPRIRVEIEPLTLDRKYWAFVSVTHNETQHVTVITPQQ